MANKTAVFCRVFAVMEHRGEIYSLHALKNKRWDGRCDFEKSAKAHQMYGWDVPGVEPSYSAALSHWDCEQTTR